MSKIHLAFATQDLDASRAFYTALFGEAPDKLEEGYIRFSPQEHPIVLSIQPGTPTPDAAHEHYGLRFKDVANTKAPIRHPVPRQHRAKRHDLWG